MFQREVSRIPLRPGNGLLIHFEESKDTLRLGRNEIENVLVLDCTGDGDPVGRNSRNLHEALLQMGFKSKHHRPATVEEYKRLLNETAPYILVHWGHGSYHNFEDRGYLHVRAEKAGVWDWTDITVPPMVLLAACETSALAQTHNNPANAWLALGARSVLATFLPVQADLTCTLLTRIFANLDEAVSGKQVLPDWATVVSKTIVLQRYLDFYYGYQAWRFRKGLTQVPHEFVFEYTYRWNKQIRSLSLAEGYRRCPEIICEALATFGENFADGFNKYLELQLVMPHTMFFTHLGSPETILLDKREVESRHSPSEEYWSLRDKERA